MSDRTRGGRVSANLSGGIEFLDVLAVTEGAVTVLLRAGAGAEAMLACAGRSMRVETTGTLQRLTLDGFEQDAALDLRVHLDGREAARFDVRTLPRPAAAPRWTMAVVADPHVAPEGKPCAHGRLFEESVQLLRETVEDINREGADLVVLPGDLTEDGRPWEMRTAREVLDGLDCPCLPVFGDHELLGNSDGVILDPDAQRELWRETFGLEGTYLAREAAGCLIVALDTDDGRIGDAQLAWLEERLGASPAEHVFVASHRSLLANAALLDDEPVEGNRERAIGLLRRDGRVRGLFHGHKNVPTRVGGLGAAQLACPQICEFPCGWLMVKLYGGIWTYAFRGIRDDALWEKSYVQCRACGAEKWRPKYRIGPPDGRFGFHAF